MIKQIKPNISQIYFTNFGSTAYLLKINNQNILVDTSSTENKQELIKDLKQQNISPEDINIILLTHKHWDHDQNISLFPNAKLYKYENIDKLPIKEIKVIKVPGHTKDSLAFLYDKVLFSGDTLFHNGIGRTDFPESLPNKMQESLNTLKNSDHDILCPGHID